MPILKSITLSLLAFFSLSLSAATSESSPITIVTSVPVVASMVEQLTQNTVFRTQLLPPEKYSIKRIPAWIQRQETTTYPNVDIVVGIASVWQETDVYPALRSNNITIVPIDVAQAITPDGESVAIQTTQYSTPSYFWLSPPNALVMLGILKRDLIAFLQAREDDDIAASVSKLNAQYAQMSSHLRQIQIKIDERISQALIMQVAIDKPELVDLGSATLIPMVNMPEANESSLPTLLITSKKTSHSSLSDLADHILVWSIDDFSKQNPLSFTARWEKNLNTIQNQ